MEVCMVGVDVFVVFVEPCEVCVVEADEAGEGGVGGGGWAVRLEVAGVPDLDGPHVEHFDDGDARAGVAFGEFDECAFWVEGVHVEWWFAAGFPS